MKIQHKLLWLALAQVVYCSNAQTNTDLIMESFGLPQRLVTNSTVFYFNDFNNIFGTRGLTNL